MTLRQVWRFLRDCQVPSFDATVAQFNRIYNQGKKNHFTLLGSDEVGKFNMLYGLNGTGNDQSDHAKKILEQMDDEDDWFDEEDEGAEGSSDKAMLEKMGIEAEDVHGPGKVVL